MPKMNAMSLSDISDRVLRHHMGNKVFSNPALAIGSTKPNVANAGALDYSVNGIIYTKAIDAVGAAFTAGLPVVPASSTAWYLLTINAAGTVAFTPGLVEGGQTDGTTGLPLAISGAYTQNALGAIPASSTVFGALKVVTDSSHTFTPGTTNLDAAGVTVTYFNLTCVPAADLLAAGNTGSLDLPS